MDKHPSEIYLKNNSYYVILQIDVHLHRGEKRMRQRLIFFIFLLSFVFLGCILSGCIKNDTTNQQIPVTVPTTQQSQIIHASTQASDCRPPTLKKWIIEFDQFATQNSQTCIGTGAPLFTTPKYPAGQIVKDTIIGKFYWWSKLGYCEFRDDGIWILYAWDYQPHYYPGTWVRLDKDHLIYGHEYSYRVEINRPSGTGRPYNETLTFFYNPSEGKLYPYAFDDIHYPDIEIWTTRFS
jgi:hypothetical protein